MKRKGDVVVCLALVALFAAALVAAQGFRAQARLFPVSIAVAGLGFALLQLVLELRRTTTPPIRDAPVVPFTSEDTDDEEGPSPEEISPATRTRRTFIVFGWVLLFTASAWLIGFMPSVPLYMLAYLRIDARESWRTSVAFAVAAGAFFYGLFGVAVRIPFDEGFLVTLVLDNLGW